MPFFIDWRDSVHPSSTLMADAKVARLRLTHPDARELTRVLREVGAPPELLEVVLEDGISMTASFVTRRGQFVLSGDLDPHAYLGAL